ncbi:hypothetical protein FIBSPDRAFT_899988 [Athelia psychrophila]|uniref:F-box domain-containing protein n=1 Tax=Athelia psychrophila TaxID=1759441 RepID=A0A165Z0E0_9AGAM|nr:hypothetical protein FIBSPDRAFT_899988 [Fibularhizoctonia sp. CBS 109695]
MPTSDQEIIPGEEKDTRPQKKLKITASNGWPLLRTRTKSEKSMSASPGPSKLSRTKSKGKLGKLANLPEMPLDVLYEIFGHLAPLDLLHLSRTTKPFRRVLMNQSAVSVWKDTPEGVKGFPDCPSDMSEPAYANLAFDKHCHNCLTTNVPSVEWVLRVRYCNKCTRICDEQKELACPRKIVAKKYGRFFKISNRTNRRGACSEETASKHAELCKKWAEQTSRQRHRELSEVREGRLAGIKQKLQELGYQDVLQQMYSRDVMMLPLDKHPLVTKPMPLTERSWKSIENEMISFMGEWRQFIAKCKQVERTDDRRTLASRALRDFKQVYYASSTSGSEMLLPNAADFWKLPEIFSQIEGTREASSVLFKQALKSDPDMLLRWRQEQIANIIALFPSQIGLANATDASADMAQAQLAIAVFVCKKGMCDKGNGDPRQHYITETRRQMYYPEYLHHRCNRIRYRIHLEQNDGQAAKHLGLGYTTFTDSRSYSGVVRQKWSCKQLCFDGQAAQIVINILQACELDWKTTTVSEMDRLDPRLVCLKCSGGRRCDGDKMMSVTHAMDVHCGNSWVEWEMVSNAEASVARSREVVLDEQPPSVGPKWRCAHCLEMPYEPDKMTYPEMQKHLDSMHSITWGEEKHGFDYIQAVDVSPRCYRAVKMAPGGTA